MTYPPQPPLLRLPAELVQEIFLHLHQDDRTGFLRLRQASKLLRQESEVAMFKRLKFRGHVLDQEIRARLLDGSDDLATHVTTVEIAYPMQVGMMDVMERLTGLCVVIWASSEHVPACMLEFLRTHRQVQLHLVPRFSRAGDSSLDTAALSSPSLNTLDTALYTHQESEVAVLQDCLLKARGLRNLTLRLQHGHERPIQQPEDEDPQLGPGDMISALESLTMDGTTHSWDQIYTQQCHVWLQSMDWSKLRRLEMTHVVSGRRAGDRLMLPALTGRVPGLRSLTLGFRPRYRYEHTHVNWTDCISARDLRRFLEPIVALKELTLDIGEAVNCSGLEPDILLTDASSLKRLTVRLGMRTGWEVSHFNHLRTYVSQLEELEVPMEMYQERGDRGEVAVAARGTYELGLRQRLARSWQQQVPANYFPGTSHRNDGAAAAIRDFGIGLRQRLSHPYQQQRDRVQTARSVWPTRTHFILTSFPHLRHLKLRVQLRADSTQFIPDNQRGSFMNEMAEETVTRLFEESRGLQSLVVVFRFVEPSVSERTFKVEKRWMLEYERYCAVLINSTTHTMRVLHETGADDRSM